MRFQPSSATALLLALLPFLTSASPLTTTIPPSAPTLTPTPSASPAPLDPSHWHPLSTIIPTPANLDLRSPQNLHAREIVNNPAAAQPAALNPTQVSPVTTLMVWQTVAPGAPAQQVQVVYSQVFEPVPDQWEGSEPGSVGLGTIRGSVGVVKTNNKVRRGAEATAMPMPMPMDLGVERREAEAEAFVIVPSGHGNEEAVHHVKRLERRKGGKSGGSGSTGAAARVALSAGPPTLALLIAVVAALVM